MANAGSFNLEIGRFNRKFLQQAQRSAEDLTDEVVAEAKRIAPVDTGHYKGTIRKDRAFSLAGAVAALFGRGQGVWSFYVISDAEYAEALELGHSDQAPHGVFSVAASTVRARYGLR